MLLPTYFRETEIETVDGCVVYKCYSEKGYCPAIECPPGTELRVFETPSDAFDSPYSTSRDVSLSGDEEPFLEPEKLQESLGDEELEDLIGYGRRKRGASPYVQVRQMTDDVLYTGDTVSLSDHVTKS